jgi:CDP-glucose 4,6-dehydratase
MVLDEFQSHVKPSNKILITGHTGFKGTWLTLLLERLGYEVCGISLEAETDSLYSNLKREGSVQEEFLDIRNRHSLINTLGEMKPSIIFHMAAQPLVLRSYKEPVETFEINTLGTANLIDAAMRINSIEAISVITTDKVYANNNLGIKFKESDPLFGKDPYSASKVATESVVAAWQQIKKTSSGPVITAFRAGNVIGGGDHAENRLLPDLVKGFIRQETVNIRNGKSTRPWQHALDPIAGYLLATAHNLLHDDFDAMNFAPDGDSLSVERVAEIACKSWGDGAKVTITNDDSKLEAQTLQLDSSLAREKLNWKPSWTQTEAVEATIEWWLYVSRKERTIMEACEADLDRLLK